VYCAKHTDEYNSLTRASENAALCPVDASAELDLLPYNKGENVNVKLNSVLSPTDECNTGWDRLIFYEAFPSGQVKRRRFVLPVFIQNKFSAEGASTKLTLETVNSAVKICEDFLVGKCIFTDCNLIPKQTRWFRFGSTKHHFVLIFIVKQKAHHNATSDAPSNVIFC
jgi:hypothetical protein